MFAAVLIGGITGAGVFTTGAAEFSGKTVGKTIGIKALIAVGMEFDETTFAAGAEFGFDLTEISAGIQRNAAVSAGFRGISGSVFVGVVSVFFSLSSSEKIHLSVKKIAPPIITIGATVAMTGARAAKNGIVFFEFINLSIL